VLAKWLATADILSGGRVAVNVVSGWFADEFRQMGEPWLEHDERYRRSAEFIQALREIWTKDQANLAGDFYRLRDYNQQPKPHAVEGRFGLLRIEAAKGRPVLKSVRVVYSDGNERVVRMERVLGGKRATAIVQLSGSQIDHVVVNTDPKSKGTYVVQGAPVGGGVASR